MGIQSFALILLSLFALCLILGATGGGPWIFAPLILAWTAGLVALAVRMSKRAGVTVVKISADGTNQVTRLLIASFTLLSLAIVLLGSPLGIPVLIGGAITSLLLWKTRGYVPEVLRKLRPLLATDETVLGDGFGRVPRVRGWHKAFRLLAATDRRLLIVPSIRSSERFPLVDVPYREVSRFGIEWGYRGRVGTLSLTLAPGDETHVISYIAPANLVSIARALESHGVPADDPELVADAEREWEEQKDRRGAPRKRVFDRAAMNTPYFDRGMWLLLGLSAFVFYVNPFGVGLGTSRNADLAFLAVPVLCGVCGYVSRTKSALAYLVPLNLIVAPAFFFDDAIYVFVLMVMISALAVVGLWVGSALRGRRGGVAAAATSGERPVRGSLRYTLGGVGLLRLSGMILAAFLAVVVTASAAGFELSSLRLALDEATLTQVPVDGRSNLTGKAAEIKYTPGPGLREFITDNLSPGSRTDGARWELRSKWTEGYNVVSLAHYVFERPRLDNPAAIADFVARKGREHERLAGSEVAYTERVVNGRKGYVWSHDSPRGYWYFAAWFPQPVHTVRVECIARNEEQRFRRLCEEAMSSLRFR